MNKTVQLCVSLNQSHPLIWRTLLVNKNTSFFELHHIIQIAMGWKNYHLFDFNLDGYRVGMIEENDFGYGTNMLLDATKTFLTDVLSIEQDSFQYTYDLGDGWIHDIIVEKPGGELTGAYYPMCVSGALNCPPEDCGGISGFYDLLKILENPKHPEYKETKTWLGKKYSPENFEIARTNKQLKQLQKYIARWNSRD